jgi:hypothetical protein
MVGLPVPNMLNIKNPYTKPPHTIFLNLYGACLQAVRTEGPKNEVVDNLPRYAS